MLELKNIKKNKEYIKKARSLYNSAFPSAERIPFDILLYKAKGSNRSEEHTSELQSLV